MSTFFLAAVGFLGGWCLCRWFLGFRSRQSPAPQDKRDGDGAPSATAGVQQLIGVAVVSSTALVLTLLLFEAGDVSSAYALEDRLLQSRLTVLVGWLVLGFVCCAFRKEIGAALSHLLDIALVSKRPEGSTEPQSSGGAKNDVELAPASKEAPAAAQNPKPEGTATPEAKPPNSKDPAKTRYADRNLPLSVEAGLFIGIVVALVLAFNPHLFRSVTSFKAGGFEAHFAGSTQWEIQAGQIAAVSIDHKNTFAYLSNIEFNKDFMWQRRPKSQPLDAWRQRVSHIFIETRLVPILKRLYCLESKNISLSADAKAELRKFSNALSNKMAFDISDENKDNIGVQFAWLLDNGKIEPLINQMGKQIDSKDYKLDCHFGRPGRSDDFAAAYGGDKKTREKLVTLDPSATSSKFKDVGTKAEIMWDPYLIRAVADLVSYAGDRRHSESLLQAAVDKETYAYGLPVVERLSLWRGHLVAMVRSDRPWPFSDMVDRLSDLLGESRRQLDSDAAAQTPPSDAQIETANQYYRANRLDDLALGLQLFYQRALIKQRFSSLQLQKWSDWLQEVRTVLAVLEHIGAEPAALSMKDREAWQNASSKIRTNASTIQNAMTSAAVSSVLLPQQTGTPSTSDCIYANQLLAYAGNKDNLHQFFEYNNSLSDEKETYKGLLEQMGTLIENTCS